MGDFQTTPAYVQPTDVDLLRVAARRAGLPFEVTIAHIEDLAREYDKERLAQAVAGPATDELYPGANAERERIRQMQADFDAGFAAAVTQPLPSRKAADELLDAVEEAIAEWALPVTVQNRLKAAFNEVVDQANKKTLAKHGLVFEDSDAGQTCICEYDKPSRIMVGCPVHYPDPGADAEGETA